MGNVRVGLMCFAFGVLAACGSEAGTGAVKASSSTSTSTATSTSTTSTTAAAVGGVTAWSDATQKWQLLAPTAFATNPAAVAEELAAALRGSETSEVGVVEVVSVQTGEPAVVVIRESGLPGDSVASVDYEITLEGSDEGWVLSRARAQYSCRRGVDVTDATRCV